MTEANKHEADDRQLFDRIAEQYIRKDMTPSSRRARQLRLRQTLAAAKMPSDCTILEVGCGAGFSAEYLSGSYAHFFGVDYAEALINHAQSNIKEDNAEFWACNVNDFKPPKPINVILMIGVLHHLYDIEHTLKHLYDLLEPGGVIIANEPHPKNPLISFARALRKKFDDDYSADQQELSAQELASYYKSAHFQDIEIVPQGILSTPFAEVVLKPAAVSNVLSHVACAADPVLEKLPRWLTSTLSWNVIAIGRKPIS